MIKIEVEEIRNPCKGYFRAYADGDLIIEKSKQPIFAAARALLARGASADSRFEVYGRGGTMKRAFGFLGPTGGLAVSDRDKGSPRIVKYVPLDKGIFK